MPQSESGPRRPGLPAGPLFRPMSTDKCRGRPLIRVPVLDLTPEELLTTTRAVRRRLDFTRPVERDVLLGCVKVAQQAPTGSNMQDWHFVIVTSAERRAALAGLYRQGAADYLARGPASGVGADNPGRAATQARVRASAAYLVEHIHEVPAHVIPCIRGRTEGQPVVAQASKWGSIIPAAWSFMLALRAHGLGSSFTTFHLFREREAAQLLGIPFDEVMQAGLIPVAYTKGARFRPAPREPLQSMVHWDRW